MAHFRGEDAAAAAERDLRDAGNCISQACRHPWLRARRDRISAAVSAERRLPVATDLTGRLDPPGPVLVAVAIEGDR